VLGVTRVSASGAIAFLFAGGLFGTACGGEEFCAEGSYECSGHSSTAGSGGGAGLASGGSSAGSTTGGTSGTGGNGETGGSAGQGFGGAGASGGGDAGSGQGGIGAESGSAGAGMAGAGGMAPVVCDPTAPEAGCHIDTNAGIFVSPSGSDESAGSRTAPLQTIAAAIELAATSTAATPPPIFVCSADYAEHLEVTTHGIALHGGFPCPTDVNEPWIYDPESRPRVAPPTDGVVLRVRDVTSFSATDIDFVAADATTPGGNSIAAFVSGSQAVRFTRVHIDAGDGRDGAAGELDMFVYEPAESLHGRNAGSVSVGGEENACTCAGVERATVGGKGGDALDGGAIGQPIELGGGAAGQPHATNCTSGGGGEDRPAAIRGPGASVLGALDGFGWVPGSAGAGADGGAGQGGGGGGGTNGGAGGGGACGGCGGKGGGPGQGGGASIGLLVFQSTVVAENLSISAAAGSAGGLGSEGQPGQPGGARGDGTGTACDGGNGGKGADGGSGGGGAGGLSVGVLWSGDTAPQLTNPSITVGTPGAAGVGGDPGMNDGIPGIAMEVLGLT
jgi:hypothetical protein